MTLAAYWTRAGVAAVDKPLVLGPVGGGVEPPLRLLGELGWRGFVEDAGRVLARRILGRVGPSRRAQTRAAVTFAQNVATLRKIRGSGRVSVLTNATVIDLGNRRMGGSRTADVCVVGRLIRWKGPMLALRSFRHVQHADARLIFCGDGPERPRIQRAARRWGLADRVSFEGWLPRDALLSRLATSGAVLHPALHEEAGLCLAEALALGTPVVCLDHGGPAEVVRQWPGTPSATISPADPETTARRLAVALDQFLSAPPPVTNAPLPAATSFEQELLTAYEAASPRAMVWGFPRGKPQLFTNSPQGLSNGVMVYAFGRRLPPMVQTLIALHVRVPGLRNLLSQRQPRVEPVCGREVWQEIAEMVLRRNDRLSGEWLQFSSQWDKQRSSFVGLNVAGDAELFLTIEAVDNRPRGPLLSVQSFRVPACRRSFRHGRWSVHEFEPLPPFHRPARWDPARILKVSADVSRSLRLERSPDIPAHWLPMHGDLVPWNLREDKAGQLWLLDWEDAGWGPPSSDVARFVVAYHSLGWSRPERIADQVRKVLVRESAEALKEIGEFWLRHHNVQPGNWPRQSAKDASRKARELAALRVLAGRPQ